MYVEQGGLCGPCKDKIKQPKTVFLICGKLSIVFMLLVGAPGICVIPDTIMPNEPRMPNKPQYTHARPKAWGTATGCARPARRQRAGQGRGAGAAAGCSRYSRIDGEATPAPGPETPGRARSRGGATPCTAGGRARQPLSAQPTRTSIVRCTRVWDSVASSF